MNCTFWSCGGSSSVFIFLHPSSLVKPRNAKCGLSSRASMGAWRILTGAGEREARSRYPVPSPRLWKENYNCFHNILPYAKQPIDTLSFVFIVKQPRKKIFKIKRSGSESKCPQGMSLPESGSNLCLWTPDRILLFSSWNERECIKEPENSM